MKSTVIYNGVDTARLGQTQSREETRRSLGFQNDDFVLGYVGRFSAEKQVERLIDAVAELPQNFKALLVGWGAGRAELWERANARIPGRYSFVAASDYLGDYYRAMDAFCLLSSEEGYALVLLEAMLCGLPLVVTPVGSVPEIIVHRRNGMIVSGQPRAVAAAAMELKRHRHWARGLAAEGQAYAQQHGHARRMTRQYEDLLATLCRA
jgi:glycosyltransferase involved in cell wall biosynthesis